jgi:glucose/arabinose dehydrogenase
MMSVREWRRFHGIVPERIVVLGLVAIVAGAACAGPTVNGPTSPAASSSATNAPSDATEEPAGSGDVTQDFDPNHVRLDLRTIVGGLSQPVGVTNANDGSGRLFVIEQGGLIRIVKDGSVLEQPFLDIHSLVSCCGEQGLLGLAFAPDFGADGGRFFIDYTDQKGDTAIAEVTVGAGSPNVADRSSLRVLLHIAQPFSNHNGGGLAFGPDGFLYIAMGDGGSGGDPQGNGQRRDTLLGKLLRIDVLSQRPAGQEYVVPSDNPFAEGGASRPEIWAYGLRNPWRFSFDRETGDLWIGDVGQGSYEEIDRAFVGEGRGANYGWNAMEGNHCFGNGGCIAEDYAAPIAEYNHSRGDCAVIGGYVYRGEAYPSLLGGYVFGDECSGTIRGLVADGPDRQKPVTLLDTKHVISSFGEDEAGELYLTDLSSGELLQVVATAR